MRSLDTWERVGPPEPDPDGLTRSIARKRVHGRLFGGDERTIIADRFVIGHKLGAGGMSSVWRANDLSLGRAVAIKFMLPVAADATAKGEQRLLREAQALARVAHPNVVSVYDFGSHEGRVWVAMEYVPGQTLRALAGDPGSSVRARLEPWIAVGRGLAAVHDVGLVHRDVKPENVLIGDDGRVRLIDFGIVRLASSESPESDMVNTPSDASGDAEGIGTGAGTASETLCEPPGDTASTVSNPFHQMLTVRNASLGTPAYMAPEQLQGRRGTALSDQFALCLCMVEALCEARPFAEGTAFARLESMAQGKLGRLPKALPRRARRALRRGLALKPEHRWATVTELLDELERAFERRRRRIVVVGVVGVAAAAWAVGLGARDLEPSAPAHSCASERDAMTGFDDARREAIRSSFAATGLGFAAASAKLVDAELGAWDQAWHEQRRGACEATRVLGVQSEALLDRRVVCLDRVRAEFGELTRVFAEADAAVVTHAAELLAALPPITGCAAAALVGAPSSSPAELEALAELARGRALLIAGDQAGALASADRAASMVGADQRASLPSLQVRALRAELDVQAERLDAGFRGLREVADAAARAGFTDFEATVRANLATRVAGGWSQPELERWWLVDAELAVERVAVADDPRQVQLAHTRGLLAQARGDYDESERLLTEVLAAADARGLWLIARDIRMDLANSLRKREAFDDARPIYTQLIVEDTERFGPEHPRIAHYEYNLGVLEVDAGRFAHAEVHLLRAIELFERAWGQSLGALRARLTLVHIDLSAGRFERASAALDALLPRFEALLGPRHRETAHAYNASGMLSFYAGDYEASIVAYQRALAGFIAAHGPDHDDVGLVWANLGESFAALGQGERAMQAFNRGLAILERRLGRDHADLGPALKGRGLAQLDSGLFGLAIDDLERAHALLEAAADEPVELAETRFALARALGQGERATALARVAALEFAQLGLDDRSRAVHRAFELP